VIKRSLSSSGPSSHHRERGDRKITEHDSLLLGAIVGSSDDAIISKNLDGIITSWNQSAERLFGYTAAEAIGKPITILIPADRPDEEPRILARLRRGERVDHFETIRQRKDGSRLNISLTISPIKDARGQIVGASKIARDITQRKIDEQRLVEQARLLDLSGDAILVRDRQDRILYWNRGAEEMYGFSREEALGRVSHDLLRTEFPEPLPRILETVLRDGRWSGELSHARRTGSRIVTLSRWVAERDADGEMIRILESNNDITERVRAQAQLRRANQDLEHFAYSASHDLREPLRTVSLYAELLASRSSGKLDGDSRMFLDQVSRGAKQMETLLSGLMVYAEAAGQEKSADAIDAAGVLGDVLAGLARAIEESGAQVIFDPLPMVAIHRVHLQQIFQNLIGNAIKFRRADQPPIVKVKADQENANWLFCVADNGIGIAPEYQERIFGLFHRLHSAEQYSGAGIGLALCHRIVELYGGRIWVESQPGQGSSFYFTLPG
jgi:PAS domain S-box-containing protein